MSKILNNTFHFLSLIFILFIFSCTTGNKNKTTQQSVSDQVAEKVAPIEINTEAKLLLEYLNDQGDYVNSREFPSMIKASSVHEELDGNIKIIDLRDEESFAEGHIKNAANVAFSDLPEYFSNEITPSDYDKIVMICSSGQVSSYATLLLRLMGYNNVFSMKWGMSGWNKDFANDIWLDNISSDYEDQLEVSINEKALPGDFPKLNTGKNSGKEIFDERIKSMFEEGTGSIFIRVDSIINEPQNY
ncbi:MAG: rhodanese-like domain-containing protein [Prolixibacteraceae bacterium]|nr:rhodanese-like domain-containing protein [Prolixibacteraceae bacterium]